MLTITSPSVKENLNNHATHLQQDYFSTETLKKIDQGKVERCHVS